MCSRGGRPRCWRPGPGRRRPLPRSMHWRLPAATHHSDLRLTPGIALQAAELAQSAHAAGRLEATSQSSQGSDGATVSKRRGMLAGGQANGAGAGERHGAE